MWPRRSELAPKKGSGCGGDCQRLLSLMRAASCPMNVRRFCLTVGSYFNRARAYTNRSRLEESKQIRSIMFAVFAFEGFMLGENLDHVSHVHS
jgi:hypothetical protein